MKISKKVLILNILLLLGLLTACGTKKIDVTGTLTLNFSGADGYGVAELDNAYEWEESAFTEAGIESIENFSELENALIIEGAVSYNVYPSENLSNGDEVIVTAVVDNDAVKQFNIKLEAKERKFVVDGLPEIKPVDLFENINVSFDGIAPNATASIDNGNSDYYVYTKYTVEPNSKLNVGDIVTVTAEYDKDELIKNGYIAENDTKQYEVTNVAHYASELSEISDEYLEKMKKQTEDVIQAVTALWADANKYVSCEFLGNYFLTAKTEDLYSENNICYCIYKINGTTNGEEFSFYYYVSFKDIVILSDGTVSVDIMNYTKPKGSGFFNSVSGEAFILGNYWYIGYTDLDSMFNYCVTQKMEDYQYENTVMDN